LVLRSGSCDAEGDLLPSAFPEGPTQLPQEPTSACNQIRAVCRCLCRTRREMREVRGPTAHKHSLMTRGQVNEERTHCNLMLTSSAFVLSAEAALNANPIPIHFAK